MPAPIKLNLTEEEDRTLRELSHADGVPHRTRMRAMAIRLNASGWRTPQIARYLDWHEHTVRAAIRRWQTVGLAGLWEASGRGRPSRWSYSDWQALEQWADEPRRYSARQLSYKLAMERKVNLGSEQVRRILKKKL
ncbi:helix-turn-helix domain-containing protein [Candidatus Gracilibacteria bacterium]|jgi:transposase|nr:helix-turn-helix domain-containing protein [Candidatus Gracilibacteria bacterium]NJM88978.1 helix-turn-helix domain-containing protein [Hydrococcus sp. RU_2_2]NJP21748.1 helix-turn-helix domain-containing protein [Hydrococcus sp. CRU_1_1]